jgi:exodeoxyribonuclease V gamma subunit
LVRDAAEALPAVVAFLEGRSADLNLFAPDHVVVATSGMKYWLINELATRVGATPGARDGVVANLRVGYLGSLSHYLLPRIEREEDPWALDRVTMEVLQQITGDPRYAAVVRRAGGPLQAARRIADRFDRYHARRPAMIRWWESGRAVLAPTTSDEVRGGEALLGSLEDQQWQYELWRAIRKSIGSPSMPARVDSAAALLRSGGAVEDLPPRLLVVGFLALPTGAIEILQAMSRVTDVTVYLTHPSPHLAAVWAKGYESLTPHPGVGIRRTKAPRLTAGVDPIIESWLTASREAQEVLAAQGVRVAPHGATPPSELPSTLLERVQHAVAWTGKAQKIPLKPNDRSVQVHRCHNLGRQVEVLHDALLHAFREVPGLAPHDVVIFASDITAAAPLLRATFDHPVSTRHEDGTEIPVRIPVRVVDRSLRKVSLGTELLGLVVELIGGRYGVAEMLEVASHPLVAAHHGVGADDLFVWKRQVERGRVRWGLDADQRGGAGLAGFTDEVHTWRALLERALLGAALPDALTPLMQAGGVVPLGDIGVDDVDALAKLLEVVSIITDLDRETRKGDKPVQDWCQLLGVVMSELAGSGAVEVSDAFEVLDDLAAAAIAIDQEGAPRTVGAPVAFSDLAATLSDRLAGDPVHQPLVSGSVTATSFIPLRGVPYRVVCLLGIDDGAFAIRETEADDLLARQSLIGDDDPAINARRQLMDALMAARERLIVTCIGRSVATNAPVPATVALAELIDLCRSAGARDRSVNEPDLGTEIEYLHPRHAVSRVNFVDSAVVDGMTWSHGLEVLRVAEGLRAS